MFGERNVRYRLNKIGFVFQSFICFETECTGKCGNARIANYAEGAKEEEGKSSEALDKWACPDRVDFKPNQLSSESDAAEVPLRNYCQ